MDITYFIDRTRQAIFDSDLVINLEYFVKKGADTSLDVLPTYEYNLCQKANLTHVFKYLEPAAEEG